MDDNVRYISFGIKDLVKELKELNLTLMTLLPKCEKKDDENSLPF